MDKLDFLKHLWSYFLVRKKWWLAPILIIFLLFGFLFVFAQSSVVAPFIYALF